MLLLTFRIWSATLKAWTLHFPFPIYATILLLSANQVNLLFDGQHRLAESLLFVHQELEAILRSAWEHLPSQPSFPGDTSLPSEIALASSPCALHYQDRCWVTYLPKFKMLQCGCYRHGSPASLYWSNPDYSSCVTAHLKSSGNACLCSKKSVGAGGKEAVSGNVFQSQNTR